MNRILFEKEEIKDGVVTFDDVRAEHVLTVLHGEVGQVLKTGEINGLIGTSEIVSIVPRAVSAAVSTSQLRLPAAGGDAPRYGAVTIRVNHTEPSLQPWVDLILAPPRPRAMKRLLPQLATMGVGRIFLVGAKKVEKDFWGATLLKEENYRPLLIDGLMQAGTSILPTLETRRNFRKFVNEELDTLWPTANRIVAHPYDTVPRCVPARGEVTAGLEAPRAGTHRGTVLAIGPEGGWTDEEVALLESKGFRRYSLGPRILRTDTATIALLARLGTKEHTND